MEWLCGCAILTPKNDICCWHQQQFNWIVRRKENIMLARGCSTTNRWYSSLFPRISEYPNLRHKAGIATHQNCVMVRATFCVKGIHKNGIETTIFSRYPKALYQSMAHSSSRHYNFLSPYALICDKSQGWFLKLSGIDLREDCFSHGQFYVT